MQKGPQQAILESQDNYNYILLTKQHKSQALKLLVQGFAAGYPLGVAYYQLFKVSQQQRIKYLYDVWSISIDEMVSEGLSIGVFDTSKNNELVAIRMVKDLNSPSDQRYNEFMKELNADKYIALLEQKMLEQISNQHKLLLQKKGQVVQFFGTVVKEEHQGKKIYQRMVQICSKLAKQKNFKYGYSNISNVKKSSTVLGRQGFFKIGQIDCIQFEYQGIRPFALVKEENRMMSVWLKQL